MERATALHKLKTLLGKNLGYRVDPKAPNAEERATARAELAAAVKDRNWLENEMNERRRAILAADQAYQDLRAAYMDAKKRTDKLASMSHWFKFTVGVSNSIFFHVKAQGDSWEEVIANLERER